MTSPFLLADLRRDEGFQLTAYPDPLTGAEPWTIGYGHTGAGVVRGVVWTLEQAEAALAVDVAAACRGLDGALPWWVHLDDLRQDVLANMAFNLGVAKLLGFTETLAAIRVGAFADAANHMLASAWARQVGARARRLAAQMRTGAHR